MSVEMVVMIITAASLLVTLGGGLFAGFAWVLRRMDERFAQAEASVSARFDKVDERFDRVDDRIDRVEAELTEVKIAVARLEGPRPRLIIPH